MLAQANEPPVHQLAVSYGEKLGHLHEGSVNDLWNVNRERYDFQSRYMAYWNSVAAKLGKQVDALICPVTPTTSHVHGQGLYFGYTGVWNLLDFSAIALRAGRVDKAKDVRFQNYRPKGDMDRAIFSQCKLRCNLELRDCYLLSLR